MPAINVSQVRTRAGKVVATPASAGQSASFYANAGSGTSWIWPEQLDIYQNLCHTIVRANNIGDQYSSGVFAEILISGLYHVTGMARMEGGTDPTNDFEAWASLVLVVDGTHYEQLFRTQNMTWDGTCSTGADAHFSVDADIMLAVGQTVQLQGAFHGDMDTHGNCSTAALWMHLIYESDDPPDYT